LRLIGFRFRVLLIAYYLRALRSYLWLIFRFYLSSCFYWLLMTWSWIRGSRCKLGIGEALHRSLIRFFRSYLHDFLLGFLRLIFHFRRRGHCQIIYFHWLILRLLRTVNIIMVLFLSFELLYWIKDVITVILKPCHFFLILSRWDVFLIWTVIRIRILQWSGLRGSFSYFLNKVILFPHL